MSSFDELSGGARDQITEALRSNDGRLGEVFRLREEGVFTSADVVARGAAANQGAAGNLRATIRSIVEDFVPQSPAVATIAGRSIGGLLRANAELGEEARAFLFEVRTRLDNVAHSEEAIAEEDSQIASSSEVLERNVENQSGVYVYTLPTYFRTPKKTDPDRFLYKIGKTDRFVGARIKDQQRLTGLPEDPWLLRVYRSEALSPSEIEKLFHDLLGSAGHSRGTGRYSGTEWFATNLDFLDAIANAFGLEVQETEIPEE